MALGHIPDYQGSNTGNEVIRESDGSVFLKIYNGTSSALARGKPYLIAPTVASGICYLTIIAPATVGTERAIVGIVNNSILGQATILAYSYGYLQIAGYCPYVLTSGTPAANDQLRILTTGTTLVDQGANGGAMLAQETVGVLAVNVTTNVDAVYLIGNPVTVEAS
jgi:hypothetical protein